MEIPYVGVAGNPH